MQIPFKTGTLNISMIMVVGVFSLLLWGTYPGKAFCGDSSLSVSSSTDGVVINEFMADNDSVAADQDGSYEDWIELYNNGPSAVSLEGYYLSDDSDETDKWAFPAVTIEAGGYLCIWADKDLDEDGLHADFALGKSGEAIFFSTPEGAVVDQVEFGAQVTDISTGRYPNGTGDFVKLAPTYGAENTQLSVLEGDVDRNGAVELDDAILALQIVAGMEPETIIYTGADVDGDGGIGLEEALYALCEVLGIHDDGITYITLNTNSITVDGSGATAEGSVVTIGSAGTYSISGTLTDGQIIVDSTDPETVSLILNGASVTCSTTAPLFVANAEDVVIELAENTENYFVDGNNYVFEEGEDEPDAPIFSKDDLTIRGSGLLSVDANFNDAIKCKDGLVIEGGALVVSSRDDGIQGKDYLDIRGGAFTLNVGGDGLKSTNDDDPDLGYISISDGAFTIISGSDCIQAETNVNITGGVFNLTAGGGNNATIGEDDSAKGVKAVVGITIDAGTFTMDTADDAVHSDQDITINGGTFSIATGDDGIHSDSTITITGGDFNITKSYEGIESTVITIDDGNIHIVASDDALNVAGGNDDSGTGGGGFPDTDDYFLYINGGYIVVNSQGDGIDVNGTIIMTGGVVLVNGPTYTNNGALDYDRSFQISGGFLIAVGSANMAQAPSSQGSSQPSVLYKNSTNRTAGTLVHVQDSSGNEVFSFAPAKAYQAVSFSMPALSNNTSYDLYFGGSSTGTVTDGLYKGGTYNPGSKYTTFTIHDMLTTIW